MMLGCPPRFSFPLLFCSCPSPHSLPADTELYYFWYSTQDRGYTQLDPPLWLISSDLRTGFLHVPLWSNWSLRNLFTLMYFLSPNWFLYTTEKIRTQICGGQFLKNFQNSNCCFIWPAPAPMKFMYPYPFKKMNKMRTTAAATQVKGYSVYLRRLSFQKRVPQYPTLVRQMMKAKLNSCYLGSQYRILCVPTPFALQVSPLANKYLY